MAEASVLVVGAGVALGAAIAHRFARGGFAVAVSRRNEAACRRLAEDIGAAGGQARAYPADARDEAAVRDVFARVEGELGPLAAVVFNAGAWHRESIRSETAERFDQVWRSNCFAGFLVGREAARRMAPRQSGTIVFTGATASMRGSAGFAAFAAGKWGLRALAQSMARELGREGVHVAHVVIDGAIDTAFVRQRMPDLVASKAADGLLRPEALAELYWMLHHQERSAWTFELDVRPWAETMA